MARSLQETIEVLISRINMSGCRVSAPYAEPSPLTVMFNGNFTAAEFFKVYPAAIHISGMDGHIVVCSIRSVEQISESKYVVNFGPDNWPACDMQITITD